MIDIVTNLLKNIGDWNIAGNVYSSSNVECFVIEKRGEGEDKERSLFRMFKRKESIEDTRRLLYQIESFVKGENFSYILPYKEGFAASYNGVSYLCVRMENAKLFTGVERENELVGLGRNLCKALGEWNETTAFPIDIAPECIYIDSRNQYRVDVLNEKFVNALFQNKMASAIYSAPEVYKGGEHNASSQMYAIALMLYEMANDGCLPFLDKKMKGKWTSTDMKVALNQRLNGAEFEAPANVSAGVGETIMRACSFDASKRYNNLLDFEWALANCGYANSELPGRKDKGGAKKTSGGSAKAQSDDSKKKVPIIVAAIVLLFLIVGGVKLSNRKVQVPNVKDMTYEQAKKAIEDAGLELEEYTGELADNYFVESQNPAASSSVKKKSKITVQMYEVKKDVTVPELVGIAQEQGETTLQEIGLAYQIEYQFSDTMEKGTIISMSPEQSSVVKEGDTINLVVSQGKEQVEVPNVVGATLDDLDELIKGIGLDYKTEEVYDDKEEGTVVSQSVEAKTMVDKGTVLELKVSKGPEEVTTEATTTEAPRTEAPRTEAPRTEAPKTEAPKKETPKKETKKKKKAEEWDFE